MSNPEVPATRPPTPEATKSPGPDINESGVDLLVECNNFIKEALDSATWLDTFELWAFGLAMLLLVVTGCIAIYKSLIVKPAEGGEVGVLDDGRAPSTLAEIIKALPEMIKALSSAPAAVVLMVLGFLLVWHQPSVEMPGACKTVVDKHVANLPQPNSVPNRTGTPGASQKPTEPQ